MLCLPLLQEIAIDQPPSSLDYFPLLQQPDIWDSLDTPTQEKVLDCLALLLLRHLHQAAGRTAQERPLGDGRLV